MTHGLFIVFEGIDGSGKTTQAHMLCGSMRSISGRASWLTAEPSTGPVGQLIRKVLTHEAEIADSAMLHLFTADRMDHVHYITRLRSSGSDVVCDRYMLSTLAYQGGGNQSRHAAIFEMNKFCPLPDLLFFIRTDLDMAFERMRQRCMSDGERRGQQLYEGKDRLMAAINNYNTCIARYADQLAADSNVVILDGSQSIQQIADTAKFHVKELIREKNLQGLDTIRALGGLTEQ